MVAGMAKIFILSTFVVLAACGGNRVSGDISNACMGADRTAATPRLCSCVQQAANSTLSGAEQRRAAKFFEDPHQAQETRQSDNSSDERFWLRYKNFSTTASRMCG